MNIIVRDRPVDWNKVREHMAAKHNLRRDWWNHIGFQKAAQDARRAVDQVGSTYKDGRFGLSVPIAMDGILTDVCREQFGHTNWRGEKAILKKFQTEPSLHGFKVLFKEGLDRLQAESDESKLTPCYEHDPNAKSADLQKLPAYYQRGVDASKPIQIKRRKP